MPYPGEMADFLSMASTTVLHEPLTGITVYGAPEYSTSTNTLTAVIEPTQRLVTTREGKQETCTATLYILSTSVTIQLQDRITFTGSTSARRMLTCDPVYDEQGVHHYELSFA